MEHIDDKNSGGYAVRMLFWISNIRPILYGGGSVFAVILFWLVEVTSPDPASALAQLIRVYGLTALAFLYFALLASPLYAVFPAFPLRPVYIKARQALGVLAFFFGFLHAYLITFGIIGGLAALWSTPAPYFLPFMMGAAAFIILVVLSLTSPGRMHAVLGARWKPLHRLVYIAGILLLMHATILGTHFGNLTDLIPLVFLVATLALFFLESLRMAAFISRRYSVLPSRARIISFGLFALLFILIIAARAYFRP